jgi:hypothetical protein
VAVDVTAGRGGRRGPSRLILSTTLRSNRLMARTYMAARERRDRRIADAEFQA